MAPRLPEWRRSRRMSARIAPSKRPQAGLRVWILSHAISAQTRPAGARLSRSWATGRARVARPMMPWSAWRFCTPRNPTPRNPRRAGVDRFRTTRQAFSRKCHLQLIDSQSPNQQAQLETSGLMTSIPPISTRLARPFRAASARRGLALTTIGENYPRLRSSSTSMRKLRNRFNSSRGVSSPSLSIWKRPSRKAGCLVRRMAGVPSLRVAQ